jgi:hypothetical protein
MRENLMRTLSSSVMDLRKKAAAVLVSVIKASVLPPGVSR